MDLGDETWEQAPEPLRSRVKARREAHIKAYNDVVDHPWLNETDKKGRKRQRYEKETIVTGLMNNGPQPRTAEDIEWKRQDKKQATSDVFNTIVSQSELIRGQWTGYPIEPILDAGEPNRFGRLDWDKVVVVRPPYVREPFRRTDIFSGIADMEAIRRLGQPTGPVPPPRDGEPAPAPGVEQGGP